MYCHITDHLFQVRKEGGTFTGLSLIEVLSKFHDFDFKKYNGNQRLDKVARNLVDYEAGKTIFATCERILNEKGPKQLGLFCQFNHNQNDNSHEW